MQFEQLRALVGVIDTGSFEGAAARLAVTPSAISQRIKALEASTGRVLVRRETPTAVTEAGEAVLRLGRQVLTLEAEAWRELGAGDRRTVLPVAVNADSLATWLRPLLPVVAGWPDVSLQLHAEDQERTAALLRSGRVVAAITSDPVTVAGCRVIRLGRMRYLPVAAADLAARHRVGRGYDWQQLPMLRYNAADQLQDGFLSERDPDARPPVTLIPDSTVFAEAVHAGLGWGMLPEAHLGSGLEEGRLVLLHRSHLDVELHWQAWRIQSEPMQRLAAAVRSAATTGLRRPARTPAY